MANGVFTVSLDLPRPVAAALAALLARDPRFEAHAVDHRTVDGGRDRLEVYFEREPDPDELAGLATLKHAAGAPGDSELVVARLPELDWVARSLAGLPPVRAGRFLVHGRHDRHRRTGGSEIPIEIEAGQAFGTGHHGTTVGCLQAIDAILSRRRVRAAADIGTGTGILAIAMAKRAHAPVAATDIDPIAIGIARANAAANAAPGIRFAVADGPCHPLVRRNGPYDLVVANILARPLADMAAGMFRLAAPHADMVLSGILPAQRRLVLAPYRSAGFRLAREHVVEGWLTLELNRPGKRR